MTTEFKGLVTRSKKVAFMKCGGSTYNRMTKFTEMSMSKNPKEYSRKYIDELNDTSDVVGYATSISYAFDYYADNIVHKEIVGITDAEKVGDDAIREIIIVDFTKPVSMQDGQYEAVSRNYAVISDSEGGDADTYTYTGNFKAKGEAKPIKVESADDFETITIVME